MFGNFETGKKDPYKDKMKELEVMVRSRGFSGEDFRQAYIISLGVRPESEVDPKVEELAEELRGLSEENVLPLTRLSELMISLEEEELMIRDYMDLVDNLSLTDKEKEVLKSVVEEERNGILHISVEDRSLSVIIESTEEIDPAINLKYKLASGLNRILGVLRGVDKKIEIDFET